MLFFTKKAKKVKELEGKVVNEIQSLKAMLEDPNLPEEKRKKITDQLALLEAELKVETNAVKKKCGLQNGMNVQGESA